MNDKIDYRKSHTSPGKGTSYDQTFLNMNYRKFIWSWEKSVLNEIIEKYLVDNKSIKYLDFACGTGRIINFLEDYMVESIGVDVSDSMCGVALKKAKKSKIIKVDLTHENIFNDNHFDLITAFRFFLNAQKELREEVLIILSKILKDDGYIVFNIHMNKHSFYARLISFIKKLRRLNFNYNTISINETYQMVEKSGFEVVETYHFALVPIINDNTKVPIWFINPFEKFFSKIPFLKYFSRYVIFICRHKEI